MGNCFRTSSASATIRQSSCRQNQEVEDGFSAESLWRLERDMNSKWGSSGRSSEASPMPRGHKIAAVEGLVGCDASVTTASEARVPTTQGTWPRLERDACDARGEAGSHSDSDSNWQVESALESGGSRRVTAARMKASRRAWTRRSSSGSGSGGGSPSRPSPDAATAPAPSTPRPPGSVLESALDAEPSRCCQPRTPLNAAAPGTCGGRAVSRHSGERAAAGAGSSKDGASGFVVPVNTTGSGRSASSGAVSRSSGSSSSSSSGSQSSCSNRSSSFSRSNCSIPSAALSVASRGLDGRSTSACNASLAVAPSRLVGSRCSSGGSSAGEQAPVVARISFAEVEAMCDGFSPRCVVGEGGSSVVYHGRNTGCGSLAGMGDVAIKMMCTQALQARGWDEWLVSERVSEGVT